MSKKLRVLRVVADVAQGFRSYSDARYKASAAMNSLRDAGETGVFEIVDDPNGPMIKVMRTESTAKIRSFMVDLLNVDMNSIIIMGCSSHSRSSGTESPCKLTGA